MKNHTNPVLYGEDVLGIVFGVIALWLGLQFNSPTATVFGGIGLGLTIIAICLRHIK